MQFIFLDEIMLNPGVESIRALNNGGGFIKSILTATSDHESDVIIM